MKGECFHQMGIVRRREKFIRNEEYPGCGVNGTLAFF